MTLAELKTRIEQPEEVTFWGAKYVITPAFVRAKFGDGKKLLNIIPLNTRPDRYVVRVDSRLITSNWHEGQPHIQDCLDYILEAIEWEYGSARQFDEDDNEIEEKAPWPALDESVGVGWGEERWRHVL
jgi:hypothetical protein